MTVLQTPRLILRSFAAGDLDDMAAMMAKNDFMRFSLGVFSREQTAAFLERSGRESAKDSPHNSALSFGLTND